MLDKIDLDKTSEFFQLKVRAGVRKQEKCLVCCRRCTPRTQTLETGLTRGGKQRVLSQGRDETFPPSGPHWRHCRGCLTQGQIASHWHNHCLDPGWEFREASLQPWCMFFFPLLLLLHVPFGGAACKFWPSSSDLGGMSGMRYHPVMSQTAVLFLSRRGTELSRCPPTERRQTTRKSKGAAELADWKGKVGPAREISRCCFIDLKREKQEMGFLRSDFFGGGFCIGLCTQHDKHPPRAPQRYFAYESCDLKSRLLTLPQSHCRHLR